MNNWTFQVEFDGKVDEGCIQADCQANGLGDQLEKLTVDDLQTEAIPVSEPVEVNAVETVAVENVQPKIDQVWVRTKTGFY